MALTNDFTEPILKENKDPFIMKQTYCKQRSQESGDAPVMFITLFEFVLTIW